MIECKHLRRCCFGHRTRLQSEVSMLLSRARMLEKTIGLTLSPLMENNIKFTLKDQIIISFHYTLKGENYFSGLVELILKLRFSLPE